jgi:hypothetical protein
MSSKTLSGNDVVEQARRRLETPLDLEGILAKLGVREKSSYAKRLDTMMANSPRRAANWRRLAAILYLLAPHRPRLAGRAVLFFIPDGKYQLQVFALDDAADDTLHVYCEDVLATAQKAHLVDRQPPQPHRYQVLGSPHAIEIQPIDGKTQNLAACCNSMTGWNRKALRIVLPSDASSEQMQAAELLASISSLRWPL